MTSHNIDDLDMTRPLYMSHNGQVLFCHRMQQAPSIDLVVLAIRQVGAYYSILRVIGLLTFIAQIDEQSYSLSANRGTNMPSYFQNLEKPTVARNLEELIGLYNKRITPTQVRTFVRTILTKVEVDTGARRGEMLDLQWQPSSNPSASWMTA